VIIRAAAEVAGAGHTKYMPNAGLRTSREVLVGKLEVERSPSDRRQVVITPRALVSPGRS
jgi:hypothetical protein